MAEMERSRTETEIKLRFESPEAALRCLDGLGGRLIQPREFEDNIVYDRDGNPLKAAGRLGRPA